MSIKIYWGANGSYKSASAVEFDIIPELLRPVVEMKQEDGTITIRPAGRVVVTNIRGCTLERVMEQYPDVPDTSEIIYLDTSKAGTMDKLQTWFRWVPDGALIVLDEVQLIHRKAWREKDLEKFTLEVDDNGVKRKATFEEAEQLGKPHDMLDAFTRHRHFNWDLVLTTPNIKYIREDIRNTCEVAYRQANGALIGFNGKFKRSMHDASENKPSSGSLVQTLSIKKKTFKCYQSTKTGIVQDTRAGTNVFKSPRLLLALACSAGAIIYSVSSGGLDYFFEDHSQKLVDATAQAGSFPDQESMANSEVVQPGDSVETINVNHNLPAVSTAFFTAVEPLAGYELRLSYYRDGLFNVYQVEANNKSGWFVTPLEDLRVMGYQVKIISECMAVIVWQKQTRAIPCLNEYPVQTPDEPAPQEDLLLASE